MLIYIGDLTHNYKMVSNETMPLGVAYIKAYLKKKFGDTIEYKLFRYPNVILKNLKEKVPDVLMLSNYIWNESLSLFIISKAKKLSPNTVTIMGGPNFCLDHEKQKEFMRTHIYLDFYIVGEGEKPSADIIKRFIDCQLSIRKLKEDDIPSCVYIKPDGSLNYRKAQRMLKKLDDIPSPWLCGYLDEFFDGKLAPLIETVRGCPFTCSYCVQSTELYKKIRKFPVERVKKEIRYIAEAIKHKSPDVGFLCIADSNFGMFEENVDVSETIHEMQKKFGWPSFVDATTGKNKKDWILQTVANMDGALVMYNSVQSLHPEVLKNINRKNIDPEAMRDIQQQAEALGIKTLTETILSLPGETFESHKNGLFRLITLGIKQFTNYQCMILKGSILETIESRAKYNIETNYRILPRNFGIYDGTKIFEAEEVITSTSTLDFKDYLSARKLHLLLIIYYNGFRFEPLIRFLDNYKISITQWIESLFNNLEESGENVSKLFNDFLEETSHELFDSHEACIAFYSQQKNFERLLEGEIGANLLMKYLSIATFDIWNNIVQYAFNEAKKLMAEQTIDHDVYYFIDNLREFMKFRLASGQSPLQILANVEISLNFDIATWIKDGFSQSVKMYKFTNSRKVHFVLPEKKYQILKNAFIVYGEDIIGKSKLVTRIQYTDQLREAYLLEN